MSFIEFIGFIISFAALLFLVIKKFFEDRERRLDPEAHERKERLKEEKMRAFMRSHGITFEGDAKPPQKIKSKQPPKPQQTFIKLREAQKQTTQKVAPTVQQGNYGSETASAKKRSLAAADAARSSPYDLVSAESYEVLRIERTTAGTRLISSLKSPQDMLIIKEIFDKPLSMREPREKS